MLADMPYLNLHPRCQRLNITRLLFADDLLLFARADTISLQLIMQAFSNFSKASGLEANLEKSSIYFGVNCLFCPRKL
jgi:hypothetical protein